MAKWGGAYLGLAACGVPGVVWSVRGLIVAGHGGVDYRLGNAGLVPAGQGWGVSACPACWPGPASAAEHAKGLAFLKVLSGRGNLGVSSWVLLAAK